MESKVTVGSCIAMYKECNSLKQKELPAMVAYKISRVSKKVEPAVKAFEEQRSAMFSKVKEGQSLKPKQVEELKALLEAEEELSLPLFEIKDLERLNLTPGFFEAFGELIRE